ncbi:MAG TPA: Ig-like domain-containing protein [Gemmatimonadales bacterium]|nr:Ig-like domain-containing protein [Gemmatimonadales bacterium]
MILTRLLVLAAAASPVAAQAVTEVQVAPPSISIRVGEKYGLIATAYDRVGNVLPAARIQWVSNNTAVARVDGTGTVTGVTAGVAIVEARAGQKRGQAAVQVAAAGAPPPNATTTAANTGADPYAGQPPGTGAAAVLRIDPPSVYLLPSEHTRVSPRALRDDGSPAAPVQVTWKSLREDIASVDGGGTVVALAPGQGTIQMTGPNGLTATAPVVVQQSEFAIQEGNALTLAPGESDTLHVVVPTQESRLISPIALTWTSSDQSVAQVSLTGVVRATGSGKATLGVSGFLQQKGVEVLVHRAVDLFAVRPSTRADVEVPVTSTVRFEAKALAADSTPVPEARLVWSVVDTGIAGFDPATGILTGRKIGRTQLLLRGPGPTPLRTSWNISVIAGSLKLGTVRVGITQGARLALKASFIDDTGAVLGPASGLTWSADPASVAAVSEDGTVSGTGPGHARVTATAPGGKAATADVFVESELLLAGTRNGSLKLYWVDRANLSVLRRAATDTALATDPAISPDGSRVAYVSTRDGNPEIYVMDADGTNLQRVTNDPQADGRPVFTPDGAGLVFQSQRTVNGKQFLQIYSVALDGSGLKALTTDSLNQTPTVSPDGGTIAFASTRNKNADIWLMSRDGSNQRNFTKSPQQTESEPHFLRDGSLAYVVERKDQTNRTVRQVMKVNLATGAATPLTGTDYMVAAFAVAPAGDLIALVVPSDPSNRKNPLYRIYLQPTSGGTPTLIPAGLTEQMQSPVFLP